METVLNRFREVLAANSLSNTDSIVARYLNEGTAVLTINTFMVGSLNQAPNGQILMGDIDTIMNAGGFNRGLSPIWDQLAANRANYPGNYGDMTWFIGQFSTTSTSVTAQSTLEYQTRDCIPGGIIERSRIAKVQRYEARNANQNLPAPWYVFNQIANTNNYYNFNGYLCVLQTIT